MKHQGSIIATGAIRDVAGAKIMTITSTYDHRIIQGAESGLFLRRLDSLLQGDNGFYERVAESLAVTGSGEREAGSAGESVVPLPAPRSPLPVGLQSVAPAMALVQAYCNLRPNGAPLVPAC